MQGGWQPPGGGFGQPPGGGGYGQPPAGGGYGQPPAGGAGGYGPAPGAQPQPYGQPPAPGGFPQQPMGGAPAPQGFAPPPLGGAPGPQGFAPPPLGGAPAPQGFAPPPLGGSPSAPPAFGPPPLGGAPAFGPPPLGGAPQGGGSSFEFGPADNATIEKAAVRTQLWGWASIVAGLSWFVLGGVQISFSASESKQPLFMGFVSLAINVGIGAVFIKAGKTMKLVVTTRGNDIQLMMNAMNRLISSFTMQIGLTVVLLAVNAIVAIYNMLNALGLVGTPPAG